ncbi:exodeoxyribonuclease VII small subunit [Nocardioides perillae]|uniref:Exodeoxyribonuclease 7 small subunit n=1 Tax=Nocardioides perillae TaxID=1119534 RepID=A0A7Y9RWK5_9ACTN|nr:exodeoxyribonuclease VII small subunit [Nocardioides perillae]
MAEQQSPASPSYEEARAELVEVVRALEAGGTTLEESLALWERGERLARTCQDWLDGARRRLDAVLDADTGADGDSAATGDDGEGQPAG